MTDEPYDPYEWTPADGGLPGVVDPASWIGRTAPAREGTEQDPYDINSGSFQLRSETSIPPRTDAERERYDLSAGAPVLDGDVSPRGPGPGGTYRIEPGDISATGRIVRDGDAEVGRYGDFSTEGRWQAGPAKRARGQSSHLLLIVAES